MGRRNGKEVFTAYSDWVLDVTWSPDGVAFGRGLNQAVVVVNRSGGDVAFLSEEQPGIGIRAVRFSPDGRLLAPAERPVAGNYAKEHEPILRDDPSAHQIKIWDWERRKVVRTISARADGGLAFDPSGARIATAQAGGVAEIWDVDSGRKLAGLEGHTGSVTDIAYNSDGSRIATASDDGTVRLWDAESFQQVLVLRGHAGGVGAVRFSPDGSKLASAGSDGIVRVWALDLDDLVRIAERGLTRALTDEECRQYPMWNGAPGRDIRINTRADGRKASACRYRAVCWTSSAGGS